jgi:N-acetyltransferase B complex (NatB) non catalytic subunit
MKKDFQGLLESFISNCMRLYNLSFLWNVDCKDDLDQAARETDGPTDRHVGDDAALLAVMTMVHLYFMGDKGSLVRAAFLLETVLRHSQHNYDAVLLAVRVYVFMGQSARAVELFNGLDVKHIQNLSILWIPFCRTSTLHPHASKRMRCDPSGILQEAYNWVRNSQNSVRRALAECLAEKSYRNLLRTIETFESVPTSISNIMIMAALSGIRWLSTVQPPLELPRGTFSKMFVSSFVSY